MKYRITVVRKFVIDIDSEALKKLETICRNEEMAADGVELIEQACIDVETATGIPIGEPVCIDEGDAIYTVAVAEDNYPIIEW